MLNETEKRTAQAIVNVFETGTARGEYGQVTLLRGDTGHLTYGRAQTTLASGNLYLLIKAYVDAPGARLAEALEAYLTDLQNRDLTLDHDRRLRELLAQAGEDVVMQDVQDAFFDRVYWAPTMVSAEYIQAELPLSLAVVYDSRIHGAWHRLRDRTIEQHGALRDIGEKSWIEKYVQTRGEWLGNHGNRLLRRTVYRMQAFSQLVDGGSWTLPLPLQVRSVTLDQSVLFDDAPLRVSAEESFDRLLRLKDPYLRGDDVRELQEALRRQDFNVDVDEIFGPGTERAVRAFQERTGLVADGVVGAATRSALESALRE